MEGSDHLFQLDEDDLFSSDSFLEELEQADKVENVVSKHKQTMSHPGQQRNTFSKTNMAVPSMPARTATSVVPQARTPGGEGRKFSFKSKTSPEIPLPPSSDSSKQGVPPANTGERTGVNQNSNKGSVQENTEQFRSTFRKHSVNPGSNVKSMAKIPSPLANLRQLNSKRFTPVTPVNTMSKAACDETNLGSESSDALDTSLDEFKEPTSAASIGGSHKSLGKLRPAGSTPQNSRPQMSRSEVVQGVHRTVYRSAPGTLEQIPVSVRKPVMTSPPQRQYTPYQKGTPQTINKTPQTPVSSRVGSMPNEQFSNRSNNRSSMHTPTAGSAFQGSQSGASMQVRHQNVGQSPNAGSGYNANPSYDNQSRGRGVSSYNLTPPPHRHDPQYDIPHSSHRPAPGNAARTPPMHGRGKNFPGMGHPQQDRTPIAGHAHRQQTPVAGHAQQRTPVVGHAQRQHPSLNRPPFNQRQSTPGQPSRPVLTPRVAQLCKGSGPSPGAGSVHGGTRKFPGPAGLLPKLSPGQKLKDAAVALKKKVEEEEELSQEAEESREEVTDVGDFEHGAWFRMKTELGIKDGDPTSILQQNNINLVIRKASLKQLTKNKVNHLCVMIKTISLNSSDASVSLCDPSGEMQGTIHRRLIEEYQGDLRPGSVLVLRQVGVLSPSQRNHYLNITPSNLMQVFPGESNSRPCSQKTPKRIRKHSGLTKSKKRPSEEESPGNEQRSSSVTDMDPAVGRRGEGNEGLGSSDAPEVVAVDVDAYIEEHDAGIWEELLDDEDEEDVLLMDSQIGANDARPGLDAKEDGPTGERHVVHSRYLDAAASAKSSSLPISPSEKPATGQVSPPQKHSLSSSSADAKLSSLSSSGVLPIMTKRCHPVSSKPTPNMVKHPEEIKRPCLRDISGLGSNAGGGFKPSGPNKVQNNCREESIGDLLDGLEDELFEDF